MAILEYCCVRSDRSCQKRILILSLIISFVNNNWIEWFSVVSIFLFRIHLQDFFSHLQLLSLLFEDLFKRFNAEVNHNARNTESRCNFFGPSLDCGTNTFYKLFDSLKRLQTKRFQSQGLHRYAIVIKESGMFLHINKDSNTMQGCNQIFWHRRAKSC